MLKSEDRLKLELHGTMSVELMTSLQMLYAPLLGQDATLLYQTLLTLACLPTKIRNHLLVSKICGLRAERIEQLRAILEQYLLIKTYYDGAKNAYLYAIYVPKQPEEFLRHDVFGRLYMKKMGKQVYEFARKSFAKNYEDCSSYQNITSSMRNLFHDWEETQEKSFTQLKPKKAIHETAYDFNIDVFITGLSNMLLPQSQRTVENLTFIAEKASIYGISEKDMQSLVGKSMDIKTNTLDRNKLISFMQRARKEFHKTYKDPYQMPPIRFLQEKQHGVAVSSADQHLIDGILLEKYHLVPEVINVLIEYVLKRCNQVLSKAYVEKVAATWVRLGVDSAKKALEVIANEQQPNTTFYQKTTEKKLPDWFENQDIIDVANEEVDDDALMERLRKLGEE